jgi:hypothetical protein
MAKKDKNPPTSASNRFTKCPDQLLCDVTVSHAALRIWLMIERHRFKNSANSHPGINTIAKLAGLSARQAMRLVAELETKGYLTVERKFGDYSTYTPRTPMSPVADDANPDNIVSGLPIEPRNHNVTVDVDSNAIMLESTDQEPVTSMSRVNSNKPVTPMSPVDPKPVPFLSQTSDTSVTLIRLKNKNKELEGVNASSTTTKKSKNRKTKKPKAEPIKDPIQLKAEMVKLRNNISNIREEFGDKIDVDAVFRDFEYEMLNGDKYIDEPNPENITGFKNAFRNWCKWRVNNNNGNGNRSTYPQQQTHRDLPLL